MYKIWQKDGLSRKQRILNTQVSGNISLLNDDFHLLSYKAFKFASKIKFHNNDEETFDQLFMRSILFSISYIRKMDILKEEQNFLMLIENDFYTARHKEEKIIIELRKIITLFDGWIKNASSFESNGINLKLSTDISNQIVTNLRLPVANLFEHCRQKHKGIDLPNLSYIWRTNETLSEITDPLRFYKSIFYRFINSISILKNHLEVYEKEVFESGYNDPAVGLLSAFFTNHNKISKLFNSRWNQYPNFYLDQILKATQLKAKPDYTYLKLSKTPALNYLSIPQNTLFKTPDEVNFRNTEEFIINNISLKKIYGLFNEMDEQIEPSNDFGFTTSVQCFDRTSLIDRPVTDINQSESLFGNKPDNIQGKTELNIRHTPVGLLIKSWSFLMREGDRELILRFILSSESVTNLESLIDKICKKLNYPFREASYKLLHNIFHIEISTENGWEKVDNYSVELDQNQKESALVINLRFSESFPSICSLPEETGMLFPPSLRIIINHNTWMFPYSWLKITEFERVKIETKVSKLQNIQIYSELGKLDTSMPFYPFGVIPRKGAWMVMGSYEMSVKNVAGMNIHFHWSDLPDDDYGFAGYYSQYQNDIDNCSFLVTSQTLKNRKWQPMASNSKYFLFNTDLEEGRHGTAPKAKLMEASHLAGIQTDEQEPCIQKEEEFNFNMFSRAGFFRLALTNPAMGFGHSQYQKIISDSILEKIQSKKRIEMPNLPYAPQIDQISVDYWSSEEITLDVNRKHGSQFFHIHPFGQTLLNNSANIRKFSFVPELSGQGNLLLGFDGVEGGETIRLFIDMQPQKREIDRTQLPLSKWYFGNGYNWESLPSNSIIIDETRNLLVTGIIEISVPGDIPNTVDSMENLFWLRVSIEENIENISEVSGIYLHVIKVERVLPDDVSGKYKPVPSLSITEPAQRIPGLDEVIQLKNSSGGKLPESHRMMQVRQAERISHRNRAINARDFERIILENFPAVQKVKCFPGIDSKSNRAGVVTIAIIERNQKKIYARMPKSNCQLLLEIEDFLKSVTGIFTIVDLINPIYEFIQVRCKVTFSTNQSEGYYLQKLNDEINSYIAFWETDNDVPVFGHSISIIELANYIRSREYVDHIENFSLIHLSEEYKNLYELKEFEEFETITGEADSLVSTIRVLLNNREIQVKELDPIKASKPWGILIPMNTHQLVSCWEDQTEKVGIDNLEIGNTFVIQ